MTAREECRSGHPFVEGSFAMVKNGAGRMVRRCLVCKNERRRVKPRSFDPAPYTFSVGMFDSDLPEGASRSVAVLVADVVPRDQVRSVLDILGIELAA